MGDDALPPTAFVTGQAYPIDGGVLVS